MMTTELFGNTDDFILYANVKKSMPFDKIEAYIESAVLLVGKYIGQSALQYALDDTTLCEILRHAVAPIAVSIGSAELSINFGDSGHTVAKSDREAPAGDAKIDAYARAAYRRGMTYVDDLLCALEQIESVRSAPDFPLNHEGIMKGYDSLSKWMPAGIPSSPLLYSALRRYMQDVEYDIVAPVVSLVQYLEFCTGQWQPNQLLLRRTMERMVVESALLRWTEAQLSADHYFSQYLVPIEVYKARERVNIARFESEWNALQQKSAADSDFESNNMLFVS